MDQPGSTPPAKIRDPFPWRYVLVSVAVTVVVVIGIGIMYAKIGYLSGRVSDLFSRNADLREQNAILDGRIGSLLNKGQVVTENHVRGLVANFLDLTLPPEPINYTSAATLLAEPLATELRNDPSAIPRWYGIQDGPTAFAVFDAQSYSTTTVVQAGAFFGAPSGLLMEDNADRRWEFHLTLMSDGWKISSIEVRE